jgi:tetratricopeptide (TPR) repeat protein
LGFLGLISIDFSKALMASINNLIAEVYFRIGRTYEIMAQYQKAIDSYQIAASLDQKNPITYEALGFS